MDQVQDGLIRVVGPEIGDVPEGARLPLAIFVEVAGRKMQPEFESILERHIHSFLSEPMGVMHLGQRDTVWLRISKKARDAGFRIEHLGTVLLHKLRNDFPAIVDKVQVTLFTNAEDVERLYPAAAAAYQQRDERMGALTDESVDIFYSCALCQSYAPNHVCIITPERLGLCGAYNWLDGKAAYEINPLGGNLPVRKGDVIDPSLGQWKGINDFIRNASNGAFERFSAYSMINDPMTSCGCFECIACVLPGTGGIMIVDREYAGADSRGHDVFLPRGDDRRRAADARIHRHRHALHPFAQVHQRRRRAGAAGVDHHPHQAAAGRQAAPALRGNREAGAVREDRRREHLHGAGAADRAPGRGGTPRARNGRDDLNGRPEGLAFGNA